MGLFIDISAAQNFIGSEFQRSWVFLTQEWKQDKKNRLQYFLFFFLWRCSVVQYPAIDIYNISHDIGKELICLSRWPFVFLSARYFKCWSCTSAVSNKFLANMKICRHTETIFHKTNKQKGNKETRDKKKCACTSKCQIFVLVEKPAWQNKLLSYFSF